MKKIKKILTMGLTLFLTNSLTQGLSTISYAQDPQVVKKGFVGDTSNTTQKGDRVGNGADGFIKSDASLVLLDLVRKPTTRLFSPADDKEAWSVLQNKYKEFKFDSIAHMPTKHNSVKSVTVDNIHSEQIFPRHLEFTTDFMSRLNQVALELKWYLVPGPLPDTHDRGVVQIYKMINGEVVRLALQKEGKVFIDRDYFLLMKGDHVSRAATYFHEILIQLYNFDNYDALITTDAIAAFINIFFGFDTDFTGFLPFDSGHAFRSLCDLGIRAAPVLLSYKSEEKFLVQPDFYLKLPNEFFVYRRAPYCDIYSVSLDKTKKESGVRDNKIVESRIPVRTKILSHKDEPMIDGQIVMSAKAVFNSRGMDMTHLLDNFYMRVQGSVFTFEDWPKSLSIFKSTGKNYRPESAIYEASE